jgi:hypothetical protein
MKNKYTFIPFFFTLLLFADDTGLAPEVIDLNAKDASIELERKLPYLKTAFISQSPKKDNEGLQVGQLNNGHINTKKSWPLFKSSPPKSKRSLTRPIVY